MAKIKQFELFHGAVLTALVRRDHPVSLAMIETKPGESWSTYRINAAANLLVTHRTAPAKQKKALAWYFTFSPAQMKQLRDGPAWAALVCGKRAVDEDMQICLLSPKEIALLLDVYSDRQQSLTVKDVEGDQLKAFSGRHEKEIVVARNRLRKWRVPGG